MAEKKSRIKARSAGNLQETDAGVRSAGIMSILFRMTTCGACSYASRIRVIFCYCSGPKDFSRVGTGPVQGGRRRTQLQRNVGIPSRKLSNSRSSDRHQLVGQDFGNDHAFSRLSLDALRQQDADHDTILRKGSDLVYTPSPSQKLRKRCCRQSHCWKLKPA